MIGLLAVGMMATLLPGKVQHARAAGTLRITLADPPDSRDPHRSRLPVGWLFARLLHRGLYAFPQAPFPAGAMPVPDVATEMPVFSDDGLTVTIPLRGGLRFSGGRVFKASDAASSISRFVSADGEVARAIPFRSARAPDDRTLEITLARPAYDLAWLLAHPSAAILPAGTPAARGTVPGLGPYRVTQDIPDGRTVLERNPHWRDDPVRDAPSDGIMLTVKSSPADAFAAVGSGMADMVGEPGPPDIWPSDHRSPLEAASRCTRLVLANHRVSPLGDAAIRQRLARRVAGATVGAWTANALPPIIVGGGGDPRPPLSEISSRPSLTLVATQSGRDRTDTTRLRNALQPVADIRVILVPPDRLGEVLTSRSRPALVLFTWCGAVPGQGAAAMLEDLFGPAGFAPRSSRLAREINSARAAVDPEVARNRWKRVAQTIAREALIMASSVTPERGAFGRDLTNPMATPMFPQGDPANLSRR
ncbi:MAG: ABC transporter substrate-binding protein [Actinomycetota bacterium]